jgi:hypothetical protein
VLKLTCVCNFRNFPGPQLTKGWGKNGGKGKDEFGLGEEGGGRENEMEERRVVNGKKRK